MTRMMFMTWYGKRRWEAEAHPHESPPVMTGPMIVLAIGSVGAGAFLIINDRLQDFLAPVVGVPPTSHGFFTVPGLLALVLALAGVGLAWMIYGRVPVPAEAPRGSFPVVAARKDLYGDAFNESVLMRPGQWLTRLSVYFDNRGVDGLVNSLAAAGGRDIGAVAQAADRFRPLVRPFHVLRRRCAGRLAAGGEALDERLSLADRGGRGTAGRRAHHRPDPGPAAGQRGGGPAGA